MSNNQAYSLQREQLRAEIRVVEVILKLLKYGESKREVGQLCMAMMVLQQTDSFDFIDINEYDGYLSDIERAKKNDDMVEADELKKMADKFLADTLCDLQKAKQALDD